MVGLAQIVKLFPAKIIGFLTIQFRFQISNFRNDCGINLLFTQDDVCYLKYVLKKGRNIWILIRMGEHPDTTA